jgi:hypothetical protein
MGGYDALALALIVIALGIVCGGFGATVFLAVWLIGG